MTSDLEKRVFAHNNLPKGWTKQFRPWILVYSEVFTNKADALKREKALKSHQGREFIRKEIISKQQGILKNARGAIIRQMPDIGSSPVPATKNAGF